MLAWTTLPADLKDLASDMGLVLGICCSNTLTVRDGPLSRGLIVSLFGVTMLAKFKATSMLCTTSACLTELVQ